MKHPIVFRWSRLLLLPLALVLLGAGTADEAPFASLTAKLSWRSIGPYIGGRVVAVAGVPGDNDLFYMGGVDGGIWKSTDYGVRWTNLSDGKLPGTSDSIGALAVAPSNPKILYAGTGESDIRGDFVTGDGVFRSDDAGATWKAAGLEDTHTISGLAVDPHHPDVVYASSMGHVFKPDEQRGVFKSTDGGKTWKRILYVDDKTGAINLVMDPKNADILYAAMWQAYRNAWSLSSGGEGSGLYKTTDGGAHWTNLSRNKGFPSGVLGRVGVGVAASDPRVVYVIAQAHEGGVFRSDDGGATWTRVNEEWKLRQRAFYYMTIYVDPKDPDTVYAPEVDALFVSHDGGKTFKKLRTPHGDNHVLWINPDDTRILLEGNDGGATVSTDGGATWSEEHNQPTGQFYHVNLDGRFPFHVYGAQQDEGSFEGPSASSGGAIPLAAWRRAAYGESTFTVPRPGHPGVSYGSGYFSIFLSYAPDDEEYRSESPWPDYQEGSSAGELAYRFAWTHPILFSPTKPDELLVGAQYVLKSEDAGATWKRISPDLSRNDPATEAPTGGPIDLDQTGAEIYATVSALAVSPLDDGVIWAGSDDGLAHVTTDGGDHWQDVTPKDLPQTAYVTCIEPSHADKGTAYMTVSRYMWDDFHPYVYETTDFGAHWTPLAAGLPDGEYAFAVRQDPDDARLLFLGTRSSVFVSLDSGGNWQPLALNLPHVQVRDLAVDTREGEVVAATHGRSFWVLGDLAFLEQLTGASPGAGGARLFVPENAWLSHAYGQSGGPFTPPASGENPAFGATVYFMLPKDYDGKTPVSLSFMDSTGKLVRRFELHLKPKGAAEKTPEQLAEEAPSERKRYQEEKLTAVTPGMNRFEWNLRYPDATEVKGFETPVAAGGLEDGVDGPEVVPGRYRVTLDYGGKSQQQDFDVALDPRLHPGAGALDARLALEMQIHDDLDRLDQALNQAIEARDALHEAALKHRPDEESARRAIADLDASIGGLVQLDIYSSESSVLHPTKLRDHLAYLVAETGLDYDQPTAAEYAVFKELDDETQAGVRQLQQDTEAAKRLTH
ncbi:MAG TPA: glycosyl hydrolase [Gammaproteobacteria bacterium]|nr:glycosyl hydrolase [Gammaproteobacteria bacterium]